MAVLRLLRGWRWLLKITGDVLVDSWCSWLLRLIAAVIILKPVPCTMTSTTAITRALTGPTTATILLILLYVIPHILLIIVREIGQHTIALKQDVLVAEKLNVSDTVVGEDGGHGIAIQALLIGVAHLVLLNAAETSGAGLHEQNRSGRVLQSHGIAIHEPGVGLRETDERLEETHRDGNGRRWIGSAGLVVSL